MFNITGFFVYMPLQLLKNRTLVRIQKRDNMKKEFYSLLVFFCLGSVNSQIVFTENFTSPFNPTASGWLQQNNSIPLGTGAWFQGNGAVFVAYNGGSNDYFACNYLSQGSGPGGISNFLITPTVNLVNGAVFKFFTRTKNPGAVVFPDRLQLLMSQGSGTGAISSGTSAVGTFTNVLLDINPNLTSGGYPVFWSGYTATVTGVTGTVVGRFAFRYFVSNAGTSGTNSDYIGIDSVTYAMPCAQSVFNIVPTSTAICFGESVLLTAVTTLSNAPTSYSWSNGQTASSIVVSPLTNSSYVLFAQNSFGCVGVQSISIVVNPKPNVAIAVSDATLCVGKNVLISVGGAAAYVWSGASSATTNTFVYSPLQAGLYSFSVTGTSSAGCTNSATIDLYVNSSPTVTAMASMQVVCAGVIVTVSASGADSYQWSGGSTFSSPSFPVSTLLGGIKTFTVVGTNSLTNCTAFATTSFTILGQEICVGVEERSWKENEIKVFPNPFTEELELFGVQGDIELYNLTGEIVIKASINNKTILRTSHLAKGVYYLKIFNDQNKQIRVLKIIKK